jgi:hypothetical protein
MNLLNYSGMQAGMTIATDQHGYENVIVVAKGTFAVRPDGACVLCDQQVPVVHADQFAGEPGESSIRYESDFALRKPFCDVIVNGMAYAPGGLPAQSVEVSFELGGIRKTLRIVGDRHWEYSPFGGWAASEPAEFTTLPIQYERAFGGCDTTDRDQEKHSFETANLVGVGYHRRLHPKIDGMPLPNILQTDRSPSSPTDRLPVAGFGFLARNWTPRIGYAGTYDDRWKEERFPFLPLDFDERYFQGAPADQLCAHLNGGEFLSLVNMTAEGKWAFRLPDWSIAITVVYKTHATEMRTVVDTLIVEPDQHRFILTFRASLRLQGRPTTVREVWVGEPTPGRRRALETGKAYLPAKAFPIA